MSYSVNYCIFVFSKIAYIKMSRNDPMIHSKLPASISISIINDLQSNWFKSSKIICHQLRFKEIALNHLTFSFKSNHFLQTISKPRGRVNITFMLQSLLKPFGSEWLGTFERFTTTFVFTFMLCIYIYIYVYTHCILYNSDANAVLRNLTWILAFSASDSIEHRFP